MKNIGEILAAKGPRVESVEPHATVVEALKTMVEHNIGAVIVRDGTQVLGMFSERDATRRVIVEGLSPTVQVKEVMRIQYPTVSPDDSVEACMALITQRRTRHVLVYSGDALVGIVSIGDLVRATLASRDRDVADLHEYIWSPR